MCLVDGFRRILCTTVLAPKDGHDLLERVLMADSTLWKGIFTVKVVTVAFLFR